MSQIIPKTLILGLAVGMELEQLKPFFLSLEKTGYGGDVCLTVADLKPATLEFLRARRVNLVPFQKAYLKHKWSHLASVAKMFMKPRQQRRFDDQMLLTYIHLHCARHVYFRDYLAECGAGYERVMLADTRDILFQRDPFDFDMREGLNVFLEDPGLTIGSCHTNSTWVREGYGKPTLQELADKRIYCSGTIFGTPQVLRDYLEQVLQLYAARKPRRTIDQTTHNYIMHRQPPKAWQAFDNNTGPVLTMANMQPGQFHFNAQGLLINAAGSVFNTLHQYDRHPELARQLIQRLT
jgi:hypothetical protein